MDKPQMVCVSEKSVNYSIFDVKWIPCSAKIVVLGSSTKAKGVIQILELNSGKLELVKELEKKASLKCGSFGASSLRNTHLATGDFKGRLSVVDLERPEYSVYTVDDAHTDIINSLDAIGGTSIDCGAPEIVTGSRDGTVKIWDPRQKGSPVACIYPRKTEDGGNGSRDCWSVAFGDSHSNADRAICSGYDNGDLKLFNLRTMSLTWETNVKNGICGIEFDRKDILMNKLAVTTLEGGLHVYDMRTQHPSKGFACVSERDAGRSLGTNGVITGAKSTVWCARHLPQNRDIFISCGGSGSVRLWLYRYPDKRVSDTSDGNSQGVAGDLEMLSATTLSTQPVNSFDWSPDRLGLGACSSFDQTVRVVITTKLNVY